MLFFIEYALYMKTLKRMVNELLTLNCSQQVLAKKAGVSQMTISRWKDADPEKTNMKAYFKLEKYLNEMKDKK